MAQAASLAFRGVTLTLSSGTFFAFLSFNPDIYLCTLMSSDTAGKALCQRCCSSGRGKQTAPSLNQNI